MVQMLGFQRSDLPNVGGWLDKSLTKIPNNDRIFGALSVFAGGDPVILKEAFKKNTGPTILFMELNGLYGMYDPIKRPNAICINNKIGESVEVRPNDKDLLLLLEAKILHEMVHWADATLGGRVTTPDDGEAFERMAYGRVVDLPAHLWLSPSSPIQSSLTLPTINFSPAPSASRGIRNNNPGNIRIGDNWQGLAQPHERLLFQQNENAFCVFVGPQWGIRAMAKLLMRYQDRYQLKTLEAMISRWAPVSDGNDVNSYVSDVADHMKLGTKIPFPFGEYRFARPMIEAMIKHENGEQPYGEDIIDYGLLLAGITP